MKDYKGMAIGIPCYGGTLETETRASVSQVRHILSWQQVKTTEYTLSMCDIVDARNCMLTWWYDATDHDHLLMVDNDMQFAPSMIFEAMQFDKPLIGAVYSKRQMPDPGNPWSLIVGTPEDEPGEIVGGFQKWKYVGGGVMLIHRRLVTEMLKKMPELSDCIDPGSHARAGVTRIIRAFEKITMDNGVSLSEDNSFCERWRRCGGDVWAAIGYPIGHIGKFNYCIQADEFLGLKKPAEARAA